jgi:3-dehydroquinate synthetase
MRHLITEGGRPVSEILVERGLLDGVVLPPRPDRRRVAILAQPSTVELAERLGAELDLPAVVKALPDRDDAKSLAVAEDIYRWLIGLRLTRDDTVMGVGGGALTDVAGFVAATYLRGIESILVPTTLLGAVDAAIGGKTGINVAGKNLVGAFHHPARVIVDLEVLDELPLELRREGAAEVLKAGLIADPLLVDAYEADGIEAPLDLVVDRAVAVKAAVVSEDFREAGTRAILNYGHTVGHAVETVAGIPHGHAVTIGMVAAGSVAADMLGFPDAARQRAVIERLGLPTAAPGLPAEEVMGLVGVDKKRDGSGLRMVLLEEIGRARVGYVDDATVARALAAVGIEGTDGARQGTASE